MSGLLVATGDYADNSLIMGASPALITPSKTNQPVRVLDSFSIFKFS